MLVFRITLQKWAGSLVASGRAARWNPAGRFMVYTAGSRALACLENVVHRSGEGLNELFKIMVIEIPDGLHTDTLKFEDLPDGWRDFAQYSQCQNIGAAWLSSQSAAVLRVPSAIIQQEHNFLLNPQHPDFQQIKLLTQEDFTFDPRIKEAPPANPT